MESECKRIHSQNYKGQFTDNLCNKKKNLESSIHHLRTYDWNFEKVLCNSQIERRKSEVCTFFRNTVVKMNLNLGHVQRQTEKATTKVT